VSDPSIYRVELADVSLQVTEWPGQGAPVLLLHATGFHSRCWDEIARRLDGLHLYAVDLRFHGGSEGPGQPDWLLMADDIRQLLEKLDLVDVIGVGHSIGGYLLAHVAARTLHRFRALLLIDPVILPRQQYIEQFARLEEIDPRLNPVSRRKNHWRDAQEMYQRFRDRPPFDKWDRRILRDYCEHALREVPGERARQLACDPLHEASIYLNQSGNVVIHDLLSELKLPVTVMRAAADPDNPRNLAASPTWPGLVGALPQGREIYLPHMSHFIPMEDPDLVAKVIRQIAGPGAGVR
jgi:pimeloyl-ACP methyl ester carboxylesterase